MKVIIIKTQAEIDALPDKFSEFTRIYIQGTERICVKKAWGNSSVVAWGNSSVEAWGNSSVVARGNSNVEARGNSNVEAWENSNVEAWENSNVEALGNVGVHLHSDFASVVLFMYAVCWLIAKKGKVEKKSDTAAIIHVERKAGLERWLEENAIENSKSITVFKKVSKDLKTQENTNNETLWKIGSTITHKNWNPKEEECGSGKFHACSRPYFCDEFRKVRGDRYVAIEVKKEDLYSWPNAEYTHKIAFRKGKVLFECDKFGEKIND